MIEGNRLEVDQISQVLKAEGHFPGRQRDEHEVKGYYAALTQVEKWAAQGAPVTEKMIQILHALVMGQGKTRVKGTPYRDGQNVIRDSHTGQIIYMPPEAKDVPQLMKNFVDWINRSHQLPSPIVAAIAHYQFATIHPYYDGNGRSARLLTTLILHLGGYDLKGLYSLEEYYTRNLGFYYDAIQADADITRWVAYFTEGMAVSFENVLKRMSQERGAPDQAEFIRKLDPRQRKVLELFQEFAIVTASQIGELFGFKPRTSAKICKDWVEEGFLEIVDFSNKGRKYRLANRYSR
jgi:Fic family protein